MGPKDVHSTVKSAAEEALCIAFRKHTLLPLDDCLYALQATVPSQRRPPAARLRGGSCNHRARRQARSVSDPPNVRRSGTGLRV